MSPGLVNDPGIHELWLDNLYIDSTRARIEVCNASTIDQTANCEIQIPHTTWNDNTIEFTANLGSFDGSEQLYLFVVNADGNVSEGYPLENAEPEEYTDYGHYRIRNNHPRIFSTPALIAEVKDRCTGPNARSPYREWFQGLQTRADAGLVHDLLNLALLFNFTGEQQYLDMYLQELNTALDSLLAGTNYISSSVLGSMDIVWDELSDELKLKALRVGGQNEWCWASIASSQSSNISIGYHGAYCARNVLAFAGLFANEDILQNPEVINNPGIYKFNVPNYLNVSFEELTPSGHFYNIENFVAGNYPNPNVLQGSLGGTYDGPYDASEEAWSAELIFIAEMLSGNNYHDDFARDKNKGIFWHSLWLPFTFTNYTTPFWNGMNESSWFALSQLWNTQPQTDFPPVRVNLFLAYMYADPRIQYFIERASMKEYVYYNTNFNGIWQYLLFYDDAIEPIGPYQGMPLASYFSGPGILTMRENLSTDALFSFFTSSDYFLAGRRYSDANAFQLYKKEHLIPRGGSRIRYNYDNGKHTSYHTFSWSTNTLRFMDPNAVEGTCGEFNPAYYNITDNISRHLGGQLCHTDSRHQKVANINYNEFSDITRFYHDEDITYVLGEAKKSYAQVSYFDREYVYLRPDTIVIFDRFETVGDNFRKSFRMHTVPEPIISETPVSTANNAKVYDNAQYVKIAGFNTTLHMSLLLPQNNEVTIRGGDHILVNSSLNSEISPGAISDIPRWLELFGAGINALGNLTIEGETAEASADSESVQMNTSRRVFQTLNCNTGTSTTQMTCTGASWAPDQWKDYMVDYGYGRSLVTGNSANTLYGSFPGNNNFYRVTLFLYLANTFRHWKRIDRITSNELDLTKFIISSPEYFDIDDYEGRVHTFSPHSDSLHDQYVKRTDLGQYNINIEGDRNSRQGNFLNVLYLDDTVSENIDTHLLNSTPGTTAANVGGTILVFANTQEPLSAFEISGGVGTAYAFGCLPGTTYYVLEDGGTVRVSTSNNGGEASTANDMGILQLDLGPGCALPHDYPTCDCIDHDELMESIQAFFSGDLTLQQLIVNIQTWKVCDDE
ncbi:MAG: hypothetical protein V1735_02170 [Nanoarchaeota archaeon]